MAFDEARARIHLASVASSSVGRGLVVATQPLSEWYKDQGGKKALLTCTIRSPVALEHPVPLRCTLLLENGTIPEQAGLLEIPSIAGSTDMLALGPHASSVNIRFRVLKVSTWLACEHLHTVSTCGSQASGRGSPGKTQYFRLCTSSPV
jgi:hypothetical protein